MKPVQVVLSLVVVLASFVIVAWVMSSQTAPVAEVITYEKGEPVLTDDGEVDFYPTNPFDLTASGETPVAVIEEETFDFEKMELGLTDNHDFTIRNEGKVPLKLAKGRSMCKCTVSGLAVDEIAPDESATVNLEWTPKSSGLFSQNAVIWTNDPNKDKIEIGVKGLMFKRMQQEPTSNWILGTIREETPSKFEGALYSSLIDEFKITKIEASSDLIKVDYEEMTEDLLEQNEAMSGYRILGTVLSDGTAGKLKATVTVHTDLEKNGVFTYQLTGTKIGPLQVIGSGWYAGKQLLDLGTFDADLGKTHRVTWMIEPFGEPLTVKQVSANPAFLKATLKAEDSSNLKNRERYTFTVEVPKELPDGNWPLDSPGQIVLETNHPEIGTLELGVSLKIR